MKLENGSFMPVQLLFAVTCFIQASALLSAFLEGVTLNDSWFVVLMAVLVCLPLLLIYIGLLKRYPGMNLVEINHAAYGKIFGTAASAMQIIFILTLTSLNLRDLNVFVKGTIMVKTPDIVLMLVCILVSAMAVRYGLEVVMRYAFIFSLLSWSVLLLSIILSYNLMDLNNFLPMLQQPVEKYIQGTNIVFSIPFGELVIFLMIAPYMEAKNKAFGRYLITGFLLGALAFFLVIFRDTAVLGNTIGLYAQPSFETLRLVSLFESLSRMEILFAAVLIVMLFFKVTILYYATVLAVAQIFHMKSYKPIVYAIGILIVSYALTLYPSNIQHANSGRQTSLILWQLFETVIPVLALVLGTLKKRSKKAKGAEA